MAETNVASKLQEMETNFDQRLSKLEAQNVEIINAVTKKKALVSTEIWRRIHELLTATIILKILINWIPIRVFLK